MFLSLVSLENTIDWLQAIQIRYEGGGPSGAAAAPSHACMSGAKGAPRCSTGVSNCHDGVKDAISLYTYYVTCEST